MQYITQNGIWILIALAILVFFYLRRGRHGHSGIGVGSGHGQNDSEDGERMRDAGSRQPEAAMDPVSGIAVPTAGAITSIYQGKALYFASRENRDRFEATPQDYVAKIQGTVLGGSDDAERTHRRHSGC